MLNSINNNFIYEFFLIFQNVNSKIDLVQTRTLEQRRGAHVHINLCTIQLLPI